VPVKNMNNKKDYYSILGVNRDVTQEEIKRAYRRLALEYHPDRNPKDKEAEEIFKEIGEAYAILGDQEKRRTYDRFGPSQFWQRYQPKDIFKTFSFKNLFQEFDLRFNDEISRPFFCRSRSRGCGWRKGRLFRKGFFQDYSNGPWGNNSTICDITLNSIEALWGTEKEILLKRGLETERITIKIPPGLKNDTLLSLSLKEGNYSKDRFYLRVKVVKG
jgi:curved DNA-binding protein